MRRKRLFGGHSQGTTTRGHRVVRIDVFLDIAPYQHPSESKPWGIQWKPFRGKTYMR